MPKYNKKRSYAGAFGAAAGVASKAYSAYQTYKRLRLRAPARKKVSTRKGFRGGGAPITTQHDYASKKTRRKMPAKKRRWIKYVAKVQKAVAYSETFISLVEQNASSIQSTTVAGRALQNVFTLNTSAANDLRLGAYKRGAVLTGTAKFIEELKTQALTAGSTTEQSYLTNNDRNFEFYIKSCVLTLSFKNRHDNFENIFVDVYECVSRRDMDDLGAYSSAYQCWQQCLLDSTNPIPRTGLPLQSWIKNTTSVAGCTPYDAPRFGKYWKILKKTRVLITPNAKINMQINGFRGKIANAPDLDNVSTVPKGKVKDVIIVINPTYNEDAAHTALCELQWTKSYCLEYKGQFAPGSTFTANYNY